MAEMPKGSHEELDEHLRTLKLGFDKDRQREADDELWRQLEWHLRNCGIFARIVIPDRDAMSYQAQHWPRALRARRECRGKESPRRRGWSAANKHVCRCWLRAWQEVASLILELRLKDVVTRSHPMDPIQHETHSLFVRFLTASQQDAEHSADELHRIEDQLAGFRSKLANLDLERRYVRFLPGHYFDDWLLPELRAERGRATKRSTPPTTGSKRAKRTASQSASAAIVAAVGHAGSGLGESKKAALSARERTAAASYEWVVSRHSDLASKKGRNYDEVYRYLKDSVRDGECEFYATLKALPLRRTWERYASGGMKLARNDAEPGDAEPGSSISRRRDL
jgi:hypothetical protein